MHAIATREGFPTSHHSLAKQVMVVGAVILLILVIGGGVYYFSGTVYRHSIRVEPLRLVPPVPKGPQVISIGHGGVNDWNPKMERSL